MIRDLKKVVFRNCSSGPIERDVIVDAVFSGFGAIDLQLTFGQLQ